MSRYKPDTAAYFKSEAWVEKRLKRLQIDKFACRLCGAKNVVLEVHHKPGSYDLIPHESVDDDLTTLCEACHEMFHKSWARRKKSWTKNTTRPTRSSTPSSAKSRQGRKQNQSQKSPGGPTARPPSRKNHPWDPF